MGGKTAPGWDLEELILWKDCFNAFAPQNWTDFRESHHSPFYRWES